MRFSFVLLFALFISSCSQDQSGPQVTNPKATVSGTTDKPLNPPLNHPRKPETPTHIESGTESDIASRSEETPGAGLPFNPEEIIAQTQQKSFFILKGPDAEKLYQLLKLVPESVATGSHPGRIVKQGSQIFCREFNAKFLCGFLFEKTEGRVEQLLHPSQVKKENSSENSAQVPDEDSPLLKVKTLNDQTLVRLFVRSKAARFMYKNLGTPALALPPNAKFFERFEKKGSDFVCFAENQYTNGAIFYSCYFYFDASNGSIDKGPEDGL